MKLYIRNMACESCKIIVRDALTKLKLHPLKVELGEATIKENIKPQQKQKLNNEIKKAGLEVVEGKGSILIEKIRNYIIEYVNSQKRPVINFSDFLSQKLNYEYNYLSNIFTEVEATTITNYINAIRMERAKELILFEDLTLAQVAKKLHYNNLSHFSAQFKKITGLPPSHFKNVRAKRKSIQGLNSES